MEIRKTTSDNAIPKINSHLWCYFEGDFLPAQEATISVSNQAFNYGTGVFEGIRAYKAHDSDVLNVFRLEDHYTRFLESSSLLNIELGVDTQDLSQITIELLKKNNLKCDCYIRPIGFKKALLPGVKFGVKLSGVSSGLAINVIPMGSYVNQSGIHCGVSSWRRVPDTALPSRAKITGAYVNSALAMESSQALGFDDALIFNNAGNLAEATTSNVFIVRNNKLITPPATADILPGITRSTIFRIAKNEFSLEVFEQELSLSDVLLADECFLTGTGVEVTPVISVNNRRIGRGEIGEVTSRIKSTYIEIVRGKRKEYQYWLTPAV